MSRARSSFKETDVKRLLRAIEAAGQKAATVEIEGGCIKIKIMDGNAADDKAGGDAMDVNINDSAEWDQKYGQR
jgi:hypothetical protein